MRVVLSPYAHELHYSGNRCADDCPACRWVEEQKLLKKKPVRSEPRAELVTSVSVEEPVEVSA
jgi:hypothetical protein